MHAKVSMEAAKRHPLVRVGRAEIHAADDESTAPYQYIHIYEHAQRRKRPNRACVARRRTCQDAVPPREFNASRADPSYIRSRADYAALIERFYVSVFGEYIRSFQPSRMCSKRPWHRSRDVCLRFACFLNADSRGVGNGGKWGSFFSAGCLTSAILCRVRARSADLMSTVCFK